MFSNTSSLVNRSAWRLTLFYITIGSILLIFVFRSVDHTSYSNLQSRNNDAIHERDLFSALGSAASSVGSGAASLLSGTGTVGQLLSGNVSGLVSDIIVPAGYLGTGMAMGVMAGVMNMPVPTTNATGLNKAALNLGTGLTKTLASSMTMSKNTNTTTTTMTMGNDTMSMAIGSGTINGALLALAQGLGSGTSDGLNLSSTTANGSVRFDDSGVAGAAGSLGYGLTSSLLGSINTTSLIASVTSTMGMNSTMMTTMMNMSSQALGDGTINGAALALAQGLGTGASDGLGISKAVSKNATFNTTGLNGAAGNLGYGLSNSVTSGMNTTMLLASLTGAMAMNGTMMTSVMDMGSQLLGSGTINGVALALAQGIGSGASDGLNLTTPSVDATFNTTGINGAAGNLGYGLTNSVTKGINITSLMASAKSNLGGGNISFADILSGKSTIGGSTLSQITGSIGTGLGSGASLGLGLQNASSMPAAPNGTAGAAQEFTMGLTSSFLEGGSVSKLASKFTSSSASSALSSNSTTSLLATTNFGAVAQGFAVGLLDGTGNSLNGQPTPPMPMGGFNDTVGGAATGLGLGLGSAGTNLIKQLIANSTAVTSLISSFGTASNSTTAISGNMTKRDVMLAQRGIIFKRGVASSSPAVLSRRASTSFNTSSFVDNLNSTTLDPILQGGINTIGCSGVGGFASIGLGLIETGTIDINKLTALTSMNKNTTFANNQTFIITNAGNTYTINLARMEVKINGVSAVPAIITLALHIVFAILIFFTLAPIVVTLRSIRSICSMSSMKDPFPTNPIIVTWSTRLGYLVGPPLAVATFVLGFVAKGNASHFVSAHEILGIILMVPTILTVIVAPLRERNAAFRESFRGGLAISLALSVLVLVTGFVDLSNYSFCAVQALPIVTWIVVGGILLQPMMIALGVVGVEILLVRLGGKGKSNQSQRQNNSAGYVDGENEAATKAMIGKPVPPPQKEFEFTI